MPQRQIFTVEIDGRQYDIEGDRTPTEAEARAAIGLATPQPARRLGSAKTGGAANADPNLAPDWGAFFSGLASNFNPLNYVDAAKTLLTTDPRASIPAMARGARDQVGSVLSGGTADGHASEAMGGLAGAALVGPAAKGAGAVLRKGAPKVMELGLQRTKAERLDFPHTAQRLVDEGIIPTRSNVQQALSGVESKINADAAAYDAAHPLHRVDPDTMAANAHAFATTEGKVPGLGNVPGAEASELDAIQRRYLDQNTRTRNLSESIAQKRAYAARSRYNNRPNAPTVTNNELNFNKGIAAENRAAAIRLNPALEADLAKEQDLLGALVAAENNAAKGMPNTVIGAGKSVLFGPNLTGWSAKVMDRTGRGVQAIDPVAFRAAIAQLIASQQANGRE